MNHRGILHHIMLAVILLAGFVLALVLPQVKKHLDVKNARLAVQTAKELAAAEKTFYEKNGFYTADFTRLGLELPACEETVKNGRSALYCFHYEFALEEADTIRVGSKKYPKWFTVSLADGQINCAHEEGSLAAERICAQVDL